MPALAQADARTTGIGNNAVFNDPSQTPMRSNQSLLECRGRRPLGGCLLKGKPGNSNMVYPGLFRKEYPAPHIDLHTVSMGCPIREPGIDDSDVPILLRIPFVLPGILLVPCPF